MIRKHLFLFFSLIVLTAGLNAQSTFEPEWNIGVGFGPTFSSLSFDLTGATSNPEVQNYQQFHGGISARYISEKNLGVIAELNISQQGWEGKYKDNPEYSHSHSLTYLELPVLTHIYFGRKVRFFINMGPKIQFLISEKEKISDALADAIANNTGDISSPQYNRDTERKFDYGLTGGTGLELRTRIGYFVLEGRYYYGLGDIYDNSKAENNFNRSANRVISAKLTYYMKLF